MKKALLLGASALIALGAMAQSTAQPEIFNNLAIDHISPNGKYAVSQYFGKVQILNLETGELLCTLGEEDDGMSYYSVDGGNPISNDGVVLLSKSYNGTPSVYKDGDIFDLPLGDNRSGYTNAITKDGKRIIGTVGIPMTITEDVVMQRPVFWDLQEDGTWLGPIELPYPTKDWTGRVPQYVQSTWCNEEGTILAGQLTDYSGSIQQPLVWRINDEGVWSYDFIASKLFDIEGLVFPEDPGQSPDAPDVKSFMNEDERADYEAAMDKYMESFDFNIYPNYEDYMTPEEKEAYEAAMAEYRKALNEWYEAFDAFDAAFYEGMMMVPNFEMNSVALSSDGNLYSTTAINPNAFSGGGIMPLALEDEEEEEEPVEEEEAPTIPYIFDLTTGSYTTQTVAENSLMYIRQILNDGTALGSTSVQGSIGDIYILLPGSGEYILLTDWLQEKNPELYAWIVENMTHEVTEEVYDMDNDRWETITGDVTITGNGMMDAEMKNIYTFVANNWDYTDEDNLVFSYILPLDYSTGVQSVGASTVDGPVEYFNIQGIRVNNPENGLYIQRQGNKAVKVIK